MDLFTKQKHIQRFQDLTVDTNVPLGARPSPFTRCQVKNKIWKSQRKLDEYNPASTSVYTYTMPIFLAVRRAQQIPIPSYCTNKKPISILYPSTGYARLGQHSGREAQVDPS